MTTAFAITDNAAKRISYLVNKGQVHGSNLRISVAGGGCSGFQYSFLFDDTILPEDQVFEHDGAKVIVDDVSLGILEGSVLDYVEDMVASTFLIKNPNAASSCGCGNSFSV